MPDVGANEGQYGGWLRDHGFTGRLVSVEPVASARAALIARAAAVPDWTVAPALAPGNAPGNLTMDALNRTDMASLAVAAATRAFPTPRRNGAVETAAVARLATGMILAGRPALTLIRRGDTVPAMTVRLIGSEIYRRSTYGGKHPLAIPRVSAALDLIRAQGWLDEADYLDSPIATPEELARFHRPDYIAAVQQAERDQNMPEAARRRYAIGTAGNPIYRDMFRRPATACGGSLLAARLLAEGRADAVYNIAGGTHHGRPDRASGFCYFNDPVLGILALLDRGISRVFYVDVDAHHGDGVQDAFADAPQVFTLSIHEAGRWPGTGAATDRAGGAACNLPVPAGFGDADLAFVREAAVVPLLTRFAPAVVVMQGGADGLADDPMSRLGLSNRGLWAFAARMQALAPRFLLLGGGGYHPWAVARCWAGLWATLCGRDPAADPASCAAQTVLHSLTWSRRPGQPIPDRLTRTLADPAADPARPTGGAEPQPGAVGAAVRHTIVTALAQHGMAIPIPAAGPAATVAVDPSPRPSPRPAARGAAAV